MRPSAFSLPTLAASVKSPRRPTNMEGWISAPLILKPLCIIYLYISKVIIKSSSKVQKGFHFSSHAVLPTAWERTPRVNAAKARSPAT
jgi:hypothetical protein